MSNINEKNYKYKIVKFFDTYFVETVYKNLTKREAEEKIGKLNTQEFLNTKYYIRKYLNRGD